MPQPPSPPEPGLQHCEMSLRKTVYRNRVGLHLHAIRFSGCRTSLALSRLQLLRRPQFCSTMPISEYATIRLGQGHTAWASKNHTALENNPADTK